MYEDDLNYGQDPTKVRTTKSFYLPLNLNRQHHYKYPSYSIFYVCLNSDFFIEEADAWRKEAWDIIKTRSDCVFIIITKRINRIQQCLPKDWGSGYPNVILGITVENQKEADRRIPLALTIPIYRIDLVIAPMLEQIDFSPYLANQKINTLRVSGESSVNARLLDYKWVLDVRNQCKQFKKNFIFYKTGTRLLKDGIEYTIPWNKEYTQANKANINLRFD